MTVSFEKFVHKPVPVKVVRITDENIQAVAEWCGGTVKDAGTRGLSGPGDFYIDMIATDHDLRSMRVMAFPGNWVVVRQNIRAVYPNHMFQNDFRSVNADVKAEVRGIMNIAVLDILKTREFDRDDLGNIVNNTIEKIMKLFS